MSRLVKRHLQISNRFFKRPDNNMTIEKHFKSKRQRKKTVRRLKVPIQWIAMKKGIS